jgi:hypothetical protein
MTITTTQIEKLARDYATDFALNVSVQFLMDFYIENYLDAVVLEDVVDDIFRNYSKGVNQTKAFIIKSGIDPEDVLNVLKDY